MLRARVLRSRTLRSRAIQQHASHPNRRVHPHHHPGPYKPPPPLYASQVPTFTTRFPKDIDSDTQKALLTLHIVGVIIHGKPDKRYFFAAGQQLPGSSPFADSAPLPHCPSALTTLPHCLSALTPLQVTRVSTSRPSARRSQPILPTVGACGRSCTSRWTTHRCAAPPRTVRLEL